MDASATVAVAPFQGRQEDDRGRQLGEPKRDLAPWEHQDKRARQ